MMRMAHNESAAAPDEWLPTLTIGVYNRRERLARRQATYPAIRSFFPAAFAAVGFPTRVTDDTELRRYADIMWEPASREHWLNEVGWSASEEALILRFRAEVRALTVRIFDRSVEPFMCLFPPMPILRLIEAVSAHLHRRLRILEVGPGSGALGGYCLLRGHDYLGVEITQALYLWQHRLFRWLTRGTLQDLALCDSISSDLLNAHAILIPWWHFAQMFRGPTPGGVDIVVCEAAMGEMDPFAHRYLVHLAKRLLEPSNAGLFIYQYLGEERFNDEATTARRFAAHGFRPLTCGPVRVQVGSPDSPHDLLRRFEQGPPPVDLDASSALRTAAEFLTPDPSALMESYAFFDFLRLDLG